MTNKKQTVRAWFETLPQDIKEKAFKNTTEVNLLKTSTLLSDALSKAFEWKHAPEGFNYWYDVFKSILLNEENPKVF